MAIAWRNGVHWEVLLYLRTPGLKIPLSIRTTQSGSEVMDKEEKAT